MADAASSLVHGPLTPSEHPLWGLENGLITPHTGGHTPKHWDRLADIVAENLERLDRGEELVNVVAAPGND